MGGARAELVGSPSSASSVRCQCGTAGRPQPGGNPRCCGHDRPGALSAPAERVEHPRANWRSRGRGRRLVLAGLPVVGLAGLGYQWSRPPAAPDVTYRLIDGARVRQQELLGKVVLVNFWASSCVNCIKEMPALVQTHERFAPRGYETMAVAMAYDRPDFVLHFASTRQLPFKVALDLQGEVAQAFGRVSVTPTSVLIGADGRIVQRWVGEPESWTTLHNLIESKLLRT